MTYSDKKIQWHIERLDTVCTTFLGGKFPLSGAMLLLQLSNQSQERVVFHYRFLELLNSIESTASK